LTHGQAGNTQQAISDYTAAIELPGAPSDEVARALFNRGFTHCQAGNTQQAISDYTAAIDLPGASSDLVAWALVSRGITHCQAGNTQQAISDYTAAIDVPGARSDQVAWAQINLGEVHISEGRLKEGFKCLEMGLESLAKARPTDPISLSDLVGHVFTAGLSPAGRRDKVKELLRICGKHQALAILGEALVQHIGRVYRAGEPFPSTDNLEDWASAWEEAAESVPDFRLAVRLLRTGGNFVKAGGKDRGILLVLTSPERAILHQALGLAEGDESATRSS
jgi:tetratricopeptide (TPR) repeat protein